jgi:signal transduction histidine kinase
LYEEAQRATRARERLLAIVSHDLRNLLGALKVGVKGLVYQGEGPRRTELAQRNVDALLRTAERMDRLIGDLLDFARIQSGQLAIEHQSIDAASLIRETVERFQPLAAQKSIRLESRGSHHALAECDRGRALQILSNLVSNAIKFTPERGHVVVAAETTGEEVRFAVFNSGPGIPEEQLPHIWERFWQADKKADAGTGLGLSIAQGLVQAHGGHIWVESKLGDGTTFYFTLPLARTLELPEVRP